MATGYLKQAYESTPGNELNTPTLSTKIIYRPIISFKPDLNPDPMERDDENRNQDEPLPVQPEAYDPAWSMETRGYPDSIGFDLKHLLGPPTTVVGNGIITDQDSQVVPTGAYRHRFTAPFGPSGANPQTVENIVAYKDQSTFFKMKGCAMSSLSLSSPEKGGTRLTSSGPSLTMVRVSDPSLTPSYESLAIRPFTRANLTLPTNLASTGTTEDFSITVANPVAATRSLGIASRYPDVMEKDDGIITFTGSIPKRQLDQDDWDALVNATGFALTARWVSESIIASAYPYKLYIVMTNAQYIGGEADELTNKRRHGGSFDFKATYSGSASVTVELVNGTSSYV